MLEKKEEKSLLIKIKSGDKKAKEKVLNAYKAAITNFSIKKGQQLGIDKDESVSIAMLACWSSFDSFELDSGCLWYWFSLAIKSELHTHRVKNNLIFIATGGRGKTDSFKYFRLKREFFKNNSRDMTQDELDEAILKNNIDKRVVAALNSKNPRSFNDSFDDLDNELYTNSDIKESDRLNYFRELIDNVKSGYQKEEQKEITSALSRGKIEKLKELGFYHKIKNISLNTAYLC